jgi:hypothetical protein
MTRVRGNATAAPALVVASTAGSPARPTDITARWGGDSIIMSRGWVGVPITFLENLNEFRPHRIGIAEAMFIICLMAHKWDERAPFPGYKKIARWMGKSEGYARKIARNLETKGFLRRIDRRGDTNAFELTPLFTTLVEKLRANDVAAAGTEKKKVRKSAVSRSAADRPAVA